MIPKFWMQIVSKTQDEIAHYYDSSTGDLIASTGNDFRIVLKGKKYHFTVPLGREFFLLSRFRIARRALRLDKSNAVFNHKKNGVVVLYRGRILFYDLSLDKITVVGHLKQCRNVLHCGIAVTKDGIFFGEYGTNNERNSVPVWRSIDDGISWDIVHEFPAGSIRHIHGVYADPYSNSLWVPTGDFLGECYVFEIEDNNFQNIVCHGDGGQRWRPVSMFFDADRIIWVMDSQLETSCLQVFNRDTKNLQEMQAFEGPVWFSKRFVDGSAVIQTTVEIGHGVKSNYSHIHFSEDLINWTEVARYRKDILPLRYFKFGVIAFADGPQTRDDFLIFGEALKKMDGRVYHAQIKQ